MILSVLGGVALVLGTAYGWTARDHRDAELAALTDRLAQVEARSASLSEQAAQVSELEAKLSELEAALVAAQEEAEAARQAALAPTPVIESPAESEPEEDTVVAVADGLEFGDPEQGKAVFGQCSFCHKIGQGAQDGIGPHLNGIFGRRAGAHEGFKYSEDMSMMGADGLTWNLETLNAYLENPKALVSRTRMNFAGLEEEQDRADILAYLRQFSASPQNIPEAAPTAQAREVELPDDILAIVGDTDYGEYLSSECKTCHQQDGTDEGIPSITQWPTEDFVIAMHAYKQKLRPHPVMQMMAGRLSAEEIAALAAYFGNLD
ncbi:Cytochrome c2 [Marivita hallyeonensis]|uniref:Cytochrome c2 n=1 Tax=Marivita hallyeonensis TaxID=996342 RepID=A0A1M5NEZ7_9RHOB|nr:Cytochrome c2 [Marivita hallyeonensis]